MPRNSGGTYSLPSGNPVVAGTTIEAAWANNTLSDVGNELTNSLSRQGTGGMLAALRLADGSVTVPGLAFVSETTTGFYRAASNDMRMAILGSDVWAATSSAFTISKAVTLSVASNLGTPSALTLTNATGLPLTTGVTGTLPVANGGTGITAFGTGVATALGQNVTGSGGIVLATSPTLTTPNLGTPSAVTLTNATGLPIATGVSGLGTGVATALAVNTGSSGAFVVNGGALGTPSSGTVTNLTGTASININGTVGATTPTTGSFTTLSASGAVTLSGGTANGVLYLNGSKVATSGSALTFDGTTLTSTTYIKTGGGAASNSARLMVNTPNGSAAGIQLFQDAQESWIMEVPVSSTALRWTASGTEYMRLTSTGLGIGTSSPQNKLVVSNAGAAGFEFDPTNGIMQTYNRSGAAYTNARIYALNFEVRTGASPAANTFFLDSSGNLGLGVTPSAWSSSVASQVGYGAALSSRSAGSTASDMTHGAYWNGTNWLYQYSSVGAARYQMTGANAGSTHAWYVSAGGTAGNTISFTQAMTLDASGNLGVGTTSPSSFGKLVVTGSLGTTYINDQGVALVMTRTGDNYFNAANGNFNYGAGSHVWTNSAQTVEYARITSAGNVVAGGSVALATTATDGFLYVPTCAGTPTGVPTAITGMAPIVVNTTNNKLYFYSGGAWRDAGP